MKKLVCNHCGNEDGSKMKWKGSYQIIYNKYTCQVCKRIFIDKESRTHQRKKLTNEEIYKLRTEKNLSYREIGILAVPENTKPLSKQRIQAICKKIEERLNAI